MISKHAQSTQSKICHNTLVPYEMNQNGYAKENKSYYVILDLVSYNIILCHSLELISYAADWMTVITRENSCLRMAFTFFSTCM